MASTLSKKDFKIIGISSKNPEKVIIELDKKTLDWLVSTKKRIHHTSEELSLREYVVSWEINNKKNIVWTYSSMQDLVGSLK